MRGRYQEHVGEEAPYLVLGQRAVLVHEVLQRAQLAKLRLDVERRPLLPRIHEPVMAPAGRLAVRPRHARTQREEEEEEEEMVTHLTQWGCLSLFMVLASFILLFLFSGFRGGVHR